MTVLPVAALIVRGGRARGSCAGIVVRVLGHATFLPLPRLLDALEGLEVLDGLKGLEGLEGLEALPRDRSCCSGRVGCSMWATRVRRPWWGGPPRGSG
ncbi:hypothetical protein ABZY09_40520 [Streptomyces sp. NPDC002928]|uniref:hypothetical protein n=1 Tax=Streptomyces sp. NPDC002928 TaxID=3154440 RepID=UPI0033BDB9DD